VLEANFAPRAYAESLVRLAEQSFLRRGLQLAQAAVSHVEQLRLRLVEILSKDKRRSSSLKRPALAMLGIAFMVGGYSAAHAPRLVSFSNGSQPLLAAAPQDRVLSVPEAKLQPVNLRYTVQAESAPAVAKTRTKVVHHAEPKARPVPVQRASIDGVMGDAVPLQATIVATSDREPARMPVLVVLQSEQFGADGLIFWRLTVVHLTPAQQRVFAGTTPKQI
jgi:hypothetical protein